MGDPDPGFRRMDTQSTDKGANRGISRIQKETGEGKAGKIRIDFNR